LSFTDKGYEFADHNMVDNTTRRRCTHGDDGTLWRELVLVLRDPKLADRYGKAQIDTFYVIDVESDGASRRITISLDEPLPEEIARVFDVMDQLLANAHKSCRSLGRPVDDLSAQPAEARG
jgi:hypothetical protein